VTLKASATKAVRSCGDLIAKMIRDWKHLQDERLFGESKTTKIALEVNLQFHVFSIW